MWFPILITVLAGYLLGNLNGAVCMSTLLSHDDVRTHGSGNAGLTNFIRSYGAASSVLVVLIDFVKAVIACLVGQLLLTPYNMALEGVMIGAAAVSLGHDFPALLGFKGGKGILCGLAIALVADWRCALIILAIFAIAVVITRYVSLGSVLGALGLGVFFAVVYFDRPVVAVLGGCIGALAVFMHRGNIVRLIKGTERKFGSKKKEE
jgi:glycerol-3-phosphate acyltransferase PlsY